ncbi:hypothetical protein AB0F72_20845 [Actinoplanes sp. NPDC023936]|uniref:hypothetical protein n=1 Tax=Actinoplanes sp. NPDC023936 TaxID=3154910 RepID=UPI0033EED324
MTLNRRSPVRKPASIEQGTVDTRTLLLIAIATSVALLARQVPNLDQSVTVGLVAFAVLSQHTK